MGMAETLVQTEVASAKGEVFQQTLVRSPIKNSNDIILEPQEDIRLTRVVTGEEVALSIGMLSGILPQGDLRETAQHEFEKGVSENNIGVVHPEFLNLAIALAAFQDYVIGQKVTITPKPFPQEDSDLHIRPHEEEFDLHPIQRRAFDVEI